MNRCAPPDHVLCLAAKTREARRSDSGSLRWKRREHKDEQKTLFRRADGSSFNVGDPDESQTAETKGEKNPWTPRMPNQPMLLFGFRAFKILNVQISLASSLYRFNLRERLGRCMKFTFSPP